MKCCDVFTYAGTVLPLPTGTLVSYRLNEGSGEVIQGLTIHPLGTMIDSKDFLGKLLRSAAGATGNVIASPTH